MVRDLGTAESCRLERPKARIRRHRGASSVLVRLGRGNSKWRMLLGSVRERCADRLALVSVGCRKLSLYRGLLRSPLSQQIVFRPPTLLDYSNMRQPLPFTKSRIRFGKAHRRALKEGLCRSTPHLVGQRSLASEMNDLVFAAFGLPVEKAAR